MALETVQIAADGVPYEGWESCLIEWSMEELFATFQFTATEIDNKGRLPDTMIQWNFPPGTPIQIYANGGLLANGYVHTYAPMVDAEQHSVNLIGVSFSKDFGDTSVNHPTGNFENQTDVGIVQQFAAAAGVPLEVYTPPDNIPYWQIRQGATNYQESMRILQDRQKFLMSNLNTGAMALVGSVPFTTNQTGAIIQGENTLRLEAKLTADEYSVLEVVGQASIGVRQSEHLQPFASVPGPSKRPRFKKIIDQTAVTHQLAEKRARWEMLRAKGATTLAQITVPGWRDQSGKFWQANTDVYVNAPSLKIDCWMRVQKCTFRQDIGVGTITTMILIDPFAYGASENALPCNSDGIWR